MKVTVTKGRQITIPASLLRRFGVSPGDKVRIVTLRDGILLLPERGSFKDLAGVVETERWEDVEKVVEKEREKDIGRGHVGARRLPREK
ncbi:MAG: AbrB/MazE/SpoVT family DNA-binding domain-containing protein [Candidatus Diapherotrites archaeon]|nr:AbrB/MazE/SpoVT family DNA-binding domain-containing protein [Candidatus Diapherotrites archaeon]